MKRKFTYALLIVVAFFVVLTSGCSDHKKPMKGYLSEEEIADVIDSLGTQVPTKYSYSGTLNYFDFSDELVPNSVYRSNVDFVDSPDTYSSECASYYLRLPLHITKANWYDEDGESSGISNCTRYQLEAKLYRPAGLDEVFYYKRENGGFIVRTFAVNKGLIIKRPSDITCRAKWNIEIEYDENGFLVREYFATINSSENNKSECCYGEATYTYA